MVLPECDGDDFVFEGGQGGGGVEGVVGWGWAEAMRGDGGIMSG